jgi:hypothetical protein
MHSIGGARPSLLHSLYFLTLAAVVAAIAAAITLVLWLESEAQLSLVPATRPETSCGQESWPYIDLRCRDAAAEDRRRIRLISTDRIDKTTVDTVAASAPVATVAPIETVEPIESSSVSAPPAAPETGVVPQPSFTPAEPVERTAPQKTREVSPKARAEVRPRIRVRNGEHESAPGFGMAREKSYTGAGNSFDAVH